MYVIKKKTLKKNKLLHHFSLFLSSRHKIVLFLHSKATFVSLLQILKLGPANVFYLAERSWTFYILCNSCSSMFILGDHYRQTKEGLLVLNVTEKQIGNYTCTYYFTNDDVTDTVSMKISLKPASKFYIFSIFYTLFKTKSFHHILISKKSC